MNRINWLRVIVWTPLLLFGAALFCGAMAVVGYVGPRILAAALRIVGDNPWLLVVAVIGAGVSVAKMASKDNPSW